jgi:hypothetical protein
MSADNKAPADDLVRTLDTLTTAHGLSTQHHRVLPQAAAAPTIPVRVGTALSTARVP